jgi:phosphate/sulfate permease
MRPWIVYSLVRFGLFGATFAALMVAELDVWWAAIVATIVAFTVTYIFFPGLRRAVADDLAARRARTTPDDPDADAEDAVAERP